MKSFPIKPHPTLGLHQELAMQKVVSPFHFSPLSCSKTGTLVVLVLWKCWPSEHVGTISVTDLKEILPGP